MLLMKGWWYNDAMGQGARDLIDFESDVDLGGDVTWALCAGGECAQRLDDMLTVNELVDHIVGEPTDIIKGFPARYL